MRWLDNITLAWARFLDPEQYDIKTTKQLRKALNVAEDYMMKTREITTLLQPWLPMIDNDTERIIRRQLDDLIDLEKKFNDLD